MEVTAAMYWTVCPLVFLAVSYTHLDVYKRQPVESLQRQLWELGYLDREAVRGVEGQFNEATQAAVVDAQRAMEYVNADGVATPEFQAFLFSQYCGMIRK